MARPWLINFCLSGLLAILLVVWNTDHAVSRRSFRLMFQRWAPILALRHAIRGRANKLKIPLHWEKVLPPKMIRIEAIALAASKRLENVSAETRAAVIHAAATTGLSGKMVSKFKRYSANSCGNFVGGSEDLCDTAVRYHQAYRVRDSHEMFLLAMKKFQRGIDCYATHFSQGLRSRDLTYALGLDGFSLEVRRKGIVVLGRYRTAASSSYILRLYSYEMWSSMEKLERAVQSVLELTRNPQETNEDAIERAETELETGIRRRNLSPYEQALALIAQDKAERESGIGASLNDAVGLSTDGKDDDVSKEMKSEAAEDTDDGDTTSTDDEVTTNTDDEATTSMEDGGAATTPDDGADIAKASDVLERLNEVSKQLYGQFRDFERQNPLVTKSDKDGGQSIEIPSTYRSQQDQPIPELIEGEQGVQLNSNEARQLLQVMDEMSRRLDLPSQNDDSIAGGFGVA